METATFAVEYDSNTYALDDTLKAKVDLRLEKMARGHKDITGAWVALKHLTKDNSPNSFQARVVLYHRPDNISAVEKNGVASKALLGALDAVERQLRTQRERLRKHR